MIWNVVGICLLVLLIPAMGSDSVTNSTPSLLALPRAGAALSFEQIEEISTETPDGTPDVKVLRSKVYRDSAGRLLIQGKTPPSDGSTGSPYLDLIDPVNRSRVVILVAEGIGYRFPLPKSNDAEFVFHCVDHRSPTDDWMATTQNLGTRIIDGIEFDGMRFIQISNDGSNLTNTREQWYSRDLKLLESVITSCGGRTSTTRIQRLCREEPDPILFTVPAGYKIVEPKISLDQQ